MKGKRLPDNRACNDTWTVEDEEAFSEDFQEQHSDYSSIVSIAALTAVAFTGLVTFWSVTGVACSKIDDAKRDRERAAQSTWWEQVDYDPSRGNVHQIDPDLKYIKYHDPEDNIGSYQLRGPSSDRAVIKSGHVTIDLGMSKEEAVEQLMDELDFWDYYEQYATH